MQHVSRIILSALLAKGMTGTTWAMEDVPHKDALGAAEYKRADTNFYGKGDVVRAHPTTVIIPPGGITQTGDSYFFTTHKKAPKDLYLEILNDWIEPITPPDMPASLGVPPDVMQIREPQGDVQVALPSAPANFTPVTDGMALTNGAVLKTGANGTAAVLFGGVDSARLIPNSEAAVQQTVTAQSHSAEVDLTTGAVFSKVGTQIGVKGQYEVHTPYGNASAEGGDFVTVISGSRTDVWVAQGTVELNETDGRKGPVVSSDGVGPLKIMRLPAISNPHFSFLADTDSLTTVLNFIPLADQKIKALRDKIVGGSTLNPNEQAYLARLKKVPCLIKLTLVEPPAPAPMPAPPTPAAPMAAAPIVTVPSAPAAPTNLKLLIVRVRVDGKVNFEHVTYTVDELKSKLESSAKTNPNQAFVIKAGKNVPFAQIQKVLDAFRAAEITNVNFAMPAPAEHPADNLPAPGLLMHPSMELPSNPTPTPENSTTNTPPVPGP